MGVDPAVRAEAARSLIDSASRMVLMVPAGDLDKLIATLEHADAFQAVTDPTGWLDQRDQRTMRLAQYRAARTFRNSLLELVNAELRPDLALAAVDAAVGAQGANPGSTGYPVHDWEVRGNHGR